MEKGHFRLACVAQTRCCLNDWNRLNQSSKYIYGGLWLVHFILLAAVTPSTTPSLLFMLPSPWPVPTTVEPWYNEGPKDWQDLFAITRFRYIEVLFRIFYYYWGKENCSLYRGLRYIVVPLYPNDTTAFSASLDPKKRGHNISSAKIETFCSLELRYCRAYDSVYDPRFGYDSDYKSNKLT